MSLSGKSRSFTALFAAAVVLASIPSCTTDYVTGKKTFSLVGEGQEIEMGREADVGIVAEYGVYPDEELSAYVAALGQGVARVSHRPQLTYTFRVLDDPVVNAFALPGGWVYITRGILAHFNSEDELVGVLGHEVGHVVARHGAEQMSKQVLAGVGVGLLGTIDSPLVRDLAGTSVGLLFLKFSRGQESESDRLGVEYATKNGYDAHRMADFFQTLARMSEAGGQRLPSFLSTHPDPGDREVTVNRLTDEWQTRVPYTPKNISRSAYLERIDGIVYDANPRQGFVENDAFYHPDLRFQFPVPSGWKVHNSAAVVQVVDPDQAAIIRFSIAAESTPEAAADAFVKGAGGEITLQKRESVRVGGNPAVALEGLTQAQDQQSIKVLSYFIAMDGRVYTFHGFAYQSRWSRYETPLRRTMTGLARLTDRSKLDVQPERVRVRQAPRSGELRAVLRDMGVEESRLSELAVLNGRSLSERVGKGERLKIVGR